MAKTRIECCQAWLREKLWNGKEREIFRNDTGGDDVQRAMGELHVTNKGHVRPVHG